MIATSTLVMFGLIYLNNYSFEHVFFSETRTCMALVIGASMVIVVLIPHHSIAIPTSRSAGPHSSTPLSRSALPITLTDDSDIAAAANIGVSNMPNAGYRTPAAMGTPAAL